MLLLGHTFPLDQCLNGHLFAHIVQDVHLAVRAEFEVPNGQQDSGPSSSEEEDNPQENNEVIVHLDDPPSCPSCKKHLGQVGLHPLAQDRGDFSACVLWHPMSIIHMLHTRHAKSSQASSTQVVTQ